MKMRTSEVRMQNRSAVILVLTPNFCILRENPLLSLTDTWNHTYQASFTLVAPAKGAS